MRKTLFLSTSFSTGGGEKVFSVLYRHFLHQSLFVSFDSKYDYIGDCNRIISLFPARTKFQVFAVIAGFFVFLNVVRRYRPSVVQSHIHLPNVFNVLGALVYKYESQIVVHGFLGQYLDSSSVSKRFWGRVLCFLYRRADIVIAVSKGVESELHGFQITRTKLIYNSVECLARPAQKLNRRANFCLLYAGRLHQVKKIDIILKALSQVESINLKIAGVGPELHNLRSLVSTLRLDARVEFLGFVDDLSEVFDQCDGLVLASEVETFGLSVVEALLAGIPVISSNCDTGPREIFNMLDKLDGSGIVECEKYGLLYDVGNVHQLITCIERLRKNYSYFIPDIDEVASRFANDRMLKEYESIVE